MLATLVPEPFDRPGWVYEEKYDGDRILAYKEGGHVRLLSRNEKDRTSSFPAIATAIANLRPATLLLDGEVVVFDKKGVSRFQLLQQGKGEPVYAVFDCLFREGKDLRHEPLPTRRAALEESIGRSKVLLASHRLAANGLEAFRLAKGHGYEGLVAKDLAAPYVEARSTRWLKVKVHQEDEFVIGGFTRPEGSREHFGALLLGAYHNGKLRYVGKVGTGFDRETLAHSRGNSTRSSGDNRRSPIFRVRARKGPAFLPRGWSRKSPSRNGRRTENCASPFFSDCAPTSVPRTCSSRRPQHEETQDRRKRTWETAYSYFEPQQGVLA